MSTFVGSRRIPPYKISNFITSPRRKSYIDWLNSPVEDEDGIWTSARGRPVPHKRFISRFHKDLEKMLAGSGYSLENGKEFKKDTAMFIYRLSREDRKLCKKLI